MAGERALRKQRLQSGRDRVQALAAAKQPVPRVARPEDQLTVEPIELELGLRLICLANSESGGDLMERVQQLRHRMARELGILLPKVKIRDNLRLREDAYQIKLRGVSVASGHVQPGGLLALGTDPGRKDIGGKEAIDPVSGRAGKWIPISLGEQARESGYTVAEPSQVLMAHLTEVVRTHADELLTRQKVHQLLDNLRQTSPRIIDELIPGLLKPSQVHQVLANLLRERVPVRDLETILECLADHAEQTKDTSLLTERVRGALGRLICQPCRDANGAIHAITLDPALEDLLFHGVELTEHGSMIRMTPQITEGICHELARQARKLLREGRTPVAVCGPKVRRSLRAITAGPLPKMTILGLNEIPRDTTVRSLGQIPVHAAKIPLAAESWRHARQPDRQSDNQVAVAIP